MIEAAKLLKVRNPASQCDDNYDYYFFFSFGPIHIHFIMTSGYSSCLTLYSTQRYSQACSISPSLM